MLTQLTDPPVHGTLVGSICQRYGIPSVYRYGGDRFYEWRVAQGRNRAKAFAIGNVLNRLALELADECITFGPNGTARLTDRGIDPSKIQVLPPSVEVERFRQTVKQPPLDVPDDRHILLSVGRITYLKGAATMERVIPQILDKRRDLQFVFVGPEQRHIDVSEYRDNVTMVGAVDPKRMPQYYQQADLLVHPSLTDGIPRAVLEALASRTPVLSRNVGDVATVTDNTFTRDQVLIDLVSDFEMLELDAIKPFSRESLRPHYVDFIESHRR
jgi:glycosyltransferase involved in cell wall biosynthesis